MECNKSLGLEKVLQDELSYFGFRRTPTLFYYMWFQIDAMLLFSAKFKLWQEN